MSQLRNLFCILIFVAGWTAPTFSQNFGGLFTSGDGGFSILTPGEPSGRWPVFFKLGSNDLSGDAFAWRTDEEFLSIETYRVFGRGSVLSALQKKEVIESYEKSALEKTGRLGGEIVEKPYQFLGSSGIELRSVSNVRSVIRILFLNERLIVLSAAGKSDQGIEMQLELLDSFRMLSKEQHISVLIRENIPRSLPQAERPVAFPADILQLNLKGGVSDIVETFQLTATSEKQRLKEMSFDKDGNLLKEIRYAAGYPNQIRTWGWIDGKRVSNSTTINYRPDNYDDPNRLSMSVDGGSFTAEALVDTLRGRPSTDLRYGLRYEYVLDDQKRVIERKVYSNDGSISYADRFRHSPAGIDRQVTDGTGGFIGRTFEITDSTGNVIEERMLDNSGKPYATRYFEYDLDPKGNWITKRAFSRQQVARKTTRKLIGIYSRTIKYN